MYSKIVKFIIILFVLFFFYFIFNYYFSNENYETLNKNRLTEEEIIAKYLSILPLIKNDTNNVIEYNLGYTEENRDSTKRKFWELFKNR